MSRDKAPPPPPSAAKLGTGLALTGIAFVGMIAIITTANLTEHTGSLVRWVVQCFPLLLVLPGLLMRHHRAYSWLCFIIILYFIPSVAKTMAPEGDWMDPIMLVCTLVIFFAAAMSSRWIQTKNYHLNKQAEEHHD